MEPVNTIKTKLFTELFEFVQNTKTFASDQIPDILQQLIAWKMGVAAFGVVVGLAMFWFSYKCYVWLKEKDSEPVFWGWLLSFIAGSVFTICSMLELLQLTLAPKIYIIEYLSRLVK